MFFFRNVVEYIIKLKTVLWKRSGKCFVNIWLLTYRPIQQAIPTSQFPKYIGDAVGDNEKSIGSRKIRATSLFIAILSDLLTDCTIVSTIGCSCFVLSTFRKSDPYNCRAPLAVVAAIDHRSICRKYRETLNPGRNSNIHQPMFHIGYAIQFSSTKISCKFIWQVE